MQMWLDWRKGKIHAGVQFFSLLLINHLKRQNAKFVLLSLLSPPPQLWLFREIVN